MKYLIKKIFIYNLFMILLLISIAKSDEKGCFSYDCLKDRNIDITIIFDNSLFSEFNLRELLSSNFNYINDFYYQQFKIKWNIKNINNFNQNKRIDNISELYSFHKKEIKKIIKDSEANIGLVIAGNNIKGLGIAGTFSNIAIVSNLNNLDHKTGSIIIAHELGHLFGAWHTQKPFDFMLYKGANKFDVSKESKAIIKLMRNYNFNPDSILTNEILLKRISRIYKRHHARHEIDPVARLLTDRGIEYFESKNYLQAEYILKRSLKFYGRWGKTRMVLSKTLFELNKFNDSFIELTRAVFFGEKPDYIFEKKLRDKFIELQKNNPDIENPFDV